MQIETPRLILRPLMPADATHFFKLNEDAEVVRYIPDGPFENEAASRAFLEAYPATQPKGYGRMAVLLKSTGEWLGWCGLKYHPEIDDVDLGFRFFRRNWGQGFATEAGRRSLEYGFEELGLAGIYAHVHPDNIGSQKALEKCGLLQTGTFKDTDWEGLEYRISKEHWQTIR